MFFLFTKKHPYDTVFQFVWALSIASVNSAVFPYLQTYAPAFFFWHSGQYPKKYIC